MDKRKPTLKNIDVLDQTATIEMLVDADIMDFQGHFTHFPLLPGVTQIDWALFYAVEYLNTPAVFKGMEVIKFQEPILPDMQVCLSLSWDSEREKLAFKYTSQSAEQTIVHSSGKMKLGS
ncbi:ApeI family dehydratase [Vibrio jasicida]|uniref:ApeI family dehydratase n=1 Tax=Vibrio jasicida TaxID=766224 RepID=UPI0040693EE8